MLKPLAAIIALIAAGSAAPLLTQQAGAARPAPAARRTVTPPLPIPAAPIPVSQPAASTDLSRALFITTMDGEFRRRDADGNGVISRAEMERFETAAAFAAAQVQNRNLFLRLDADRNGVIAPGEFAALVSAPATADVTVQMTRLDPNRDQQVTLIEYRAATLAGFDRLDKDLDGVVTAAEMRAGNLQPAGAGR